MAFWNRRKKRKKESAETDAGMSVEEEVQSLFEEMDSTQRKVKEKQERRKREREQKAEEGEDIYKPEFVLPTDKNDQKRYVNAVRISGILTGR